MSNLASNLQSEMDRLPKIDLHRHLEGSLRIETLIELVRREELDLPSDKNALQAIVQMQPDEPRTSANFLAKFTHLRHFFRSPEIIHRVTWEAIADAAADNVRYLELHFTPLALSDVGDFPLSEVVDWVVEAASTAAVEHALHLGLILSVNRHEGVKFAEQVAKIAVDRKERGVVGLSLAGDESNYSAEPFEPIFSAVREAGLGISIHAGEWAGPENVRYAIEVMGAPRIGHGVRVMEDQEVIRLARDRRVAFEICLTSNVQTGAVSSIREHPMPRMLQAGLQVTLNTDDPGVSDTRLSDEYALAMREFDLSLESIRGLNLTALQASFLPPGKKANLESEFLADMLPSN
ncbi:MAG TPA: adenosine deaminase [Anaerolineae bacterium]|nr:adenosine deaminase [Anaerolineae bacterium]